MELLTAVSSILYAFPVQFSRVSRGLAEWTLFFIDQVTC